MGAYCVYPDVYRPRQPKNTSLFRLLDTHYEEFRDVYDEHFSKRYGFWRPVINEVVGKYLQCGDPHYGFARIRCKECGANMVGYRNRGRLYYVCGANYYRKGLGCGEAFQVRKEEIEMAAVEEIGHLFISLSEERRLIFPYCLTE